MFSIVRTLTAAVSVVGTALGLASACIGADQQRLVVAAGPPVGLFDAGLPIRVRGLPPGARAVVRATLIDDHNLKWTSEATFSSDAAGSVDVSQTPSLGGTYTGISEHSLLCSMLPVPRSELDSYVKKLPTKPDPATSPALGARSEYKISVSAASRGAVAAVTVRRTFKAPDVTARDVSEGRLRGRLFQPRAPRVGKPAILVLGGSGGGLTENPAMLFASHGYPALALAYFGYADLPEGLVNIPLELFAEAATWLKAITGGAPVVIWGASRGSEAAMLTAAHFPSLVSGVIALDPAPVAHRAFGPGAGTSTPAWTLAGKGIPFTQLSVNDLQRYQKAAETEGKGAPGFESTAYFLGMWNDASAARVAGIPVEKITSPILLIAGASDATWPSWLAANQIRARMAAHGLGALADVHTYPGAGHGIPVIGTGNAMSSFVLHPVTKTFVSLGGLPVENCEASFDAWRQELRFLSDKVKAKPTAGPRGSPPAADH